MPTGGPGWTRSSSALEAQAAALAGEALPYRDHVARCMGFAPPRRRTSMFGDARAAIDALLPGDGSVAERLEAWDRRLEIAIDRLPAVIDWLVARFRERAATTSGCPTARTCASGS